MFQGLVKIDQSLVDPARLLQSHTKARQRFRIMRPEAQSVTIANDSFGTTIELLQDVATIEPSFRRGSVETDGLVETGQSLFEASECV